jgi:TPR repeat protein
MTERTQHDLDEVFDRAVELDRNKKIVEAVALYQSLAQAGYPPAYFKLASLAFYFGDREEALTWIKLLEAAAATGDADACLRCYHAYRLNWALLGSPETQIIGSNYLRRAADLGHSQAQRLLALEFRSGANGQVKDEAHYLYWIDKAIEGGEDSAIYDHVKWLADKKRPIPDDLRLELAALAEKWPNAAKLLARVERTHRK